MAEFPGLFIWTDAFVADTVHLSNEQVGVYFRLMIAAWRNDDCCLPDNDKRLATIVGMTRKKWLATRPIIAEFFIVDMDEWRQERLTIQREKVRGLSKKGKSAADARWNTNPLKPMKTADAQASLKQMPDACLSDAPISLAKLEEDDDDDDASANPQFSDHETAAEAWTFRDQMLAAMGLDRSGKTGRGSARIGSGADMAEAARWSSDLHLTESEQLETIRDVMAKKRGGPPSGFAYFTKAMQELAAIKAAPPIEIPTITRQHTGELQDARPESQNHPDRLNRILSGALRLHTGG